jgi:hypothetical protein
MHSAKKSATSRPAVMPGASSPPSTETDCVATAAMSQAPLMPTSREGFFSRMIVAGLDLRLAQAHQRIRRNLDDSQITGFQRHHVDHLVRSAAAVLRMEHGLMVRGILEHDIGASVRYDDARATCGCLVVESRVRQQLTKLSRHDILLHVRGTRNASLTKPCRADRGLATAPLF